MNLRDLDRVTPISQDPLNAGLLARWTCAPGFSSKTRLYDLTKRYHGTLQADALITTANHRQGGFASMSLDGTGDYADLGTAFPVDMDEGTLALWVYPTTSTGSRVYLEFRATTAANGTIAIVDLHGSGSVWVRWSRTAGAATEKVITAASLPINTWSHLAMTWSMDDDALVAYLDGVQYGSTQTGLLAATAQPATCYLGTDVFATDALGQIDDCLLWTRPLSAAEIRQVYDDSRRGSPRMLNSALPVVIEASPTPPISGSITQAIPQWVTP